MPDQEETRDDDAGGVRRCSRGARQSTEHFHRAHTTVSDWLISSTGAAGSTERLVAAREQAEAELLFAPLPQSLRAEAGTGGFGFENIVGVGIAEREVGGGLAGERAIAVYVERKAPRQLVEEAALIPPEYDGVPTDVVESGPLAPQTGRGRYRPAMSGVSVGHHATTAGTLGFLARRRGSLYVVSNNHVLAQGNDGAPGDGILQPGPADGGRASDEIANLSFWEKLDYSGATNLVDAAAAETDEGVVSDEIYGVGALDWCPIEPTRGLVVRKRGRTTELTQGVIHDVDATIKMTYRNGVAILGEQILVRGVGRQFSEGGDSGSLVFAEETRRPVGLLCGGGRRFTIVNRITNVLRSLELSFLQ